MRSGVGAFDLIDDDKVCLTNLNRQIIATRKTVGKYKTEVMKERILEINPDADVRTAPVLFPYRRMRHDFPFEEYDYVVDAVDTVTAKDCAGHEMPGELKVPIISSMGAGNISEMAASFRWRTFIRPRSVHVSKSHAPGIKKAWRSKT